MRRYDSGYLDGFRGQQQMFLDNKNQALKYSYEILGKLLSIAEKFAGLANHKYSIFNITNSYDYYDYGNLKSEFAWQLYSFMRFRQAYEKKYKYPYQFPNELPPEIITKYIYIYMKKTANKNDIFLYDCMIKIINGDKINIDFDKLFEELDKHSNSKIDREMLRPFKSKFEDTEHFKYKNTKFKKFGNIEYFK